MKSLHVTVGKGKLKNKGIGGQKATVKKLSGAGLKADQVAEATGLSVSEIKSLK